MKPFIFSCALLLAPVAEPPRFVSSAERFRFSNYACHPSELHLSPLNTNRSPFLLVHMSRRSPQGCGPARTARSNGVGSTSG